MFHITRFAENFFRSLWCVRCRHFFATFTTVSLVEFSCISELHKFSISLSWMCRRKWYAIFYMKCEFWTNNLKWFVSDRTTKHSMENMVNIFFGFFSRNYSFIIL